MVSSITTNCAPLRPLANTHKVTESYDQLRGQVNVTYMEIDSLPMHAM